MSLGAGIAVAAAWAAVAIVGVSSPHSVVDVAIPALLATLLIAP